MDSYREHPSDFDLPISETASAEDVNQRDQNICYRGILMPFSSDGDAIDFIYGVINWKTVAEVGHSDTIALSATEDEPLPVGNVPELVLEQVFESEVEETVAAEPQDADPEDHQSWEDGPSGEPELGPIVTAEEEAQPPVHFAWQD